MEKGKCATILKAIHLRLAMLLKYLATKPKVSNISKDELLELPYSTACISEFQVSFVLCCEAPRTLCSLKALWHILCTRRMHCCFSKRSMDSSTIQLFSAPPPMKFQKTSAPSLDGHLLRHGKLPQQFHKANKPSQNRSLIGNVPALQNS